MRRLLLGLLCALALFATSGTARAQTDEDTGFWFMFFGTGKLGQTPKLERWRWWLDVQPRWLSEGEGLDQFLFRPGFGYAFADKATAWLGYAYIDEPSQEGFAGSDENRIWQQLLWTPTKGRVNLQSRTRLEQRFLNTGDDVGWRFRQFAKMAWAFPNTPDFGIASYAEVFFDLNDTDWGQDTGFRQSRLFAGLAWSVGQDTRITTEVGYLNQFINRSTSPDLMNHILSINLLVNF